jgi:hypothetical protein
MVGLGRLELPTSPLSGVRSSHLSYRPNRKATAFTTTYRVSNSGRARFVPICAGFHFLSRLAQIRFVLNVVAVKNRIAAMPADSPGCVLADSGPQHIAHGEEPHIVEKYARQPSFPSQRAPRAAEVVYRRAVSPREQRIARLLTFHAFGDQIGKIGGHNNHVAPIIPCVAGKQPDRAMFQVNLRNAQRNQFRFPKAEPICYSQRRAQPRVFYLCLQRHVLLIGKQPVWTKARVDSWAKPVGCLRAIA